MAITRTTNSDSPASTSWWCDPPVNLLQGECEPQDRAEQTFPSQVCEAGTESKLRGYRKSPKLSRGAFTKERNARQESNIEVEFLPVDGPEPLIKPAMLTEAAHTGTTTARAVANRAEPRRLCNLASSLINKRAGGSTTGATALKGGYVDGRR
jgi:hypothetical protein